MLVAGLRGRDRIPRDRLDLLVDRTALRELLLEQVHRDLGVRLARELMPLREERRLERLEVLDDPVVDDRSDAAAIDVRMRVLLARPTMRGPAGVSDPGVSGSRMRRDDRRQVVELAFGAEDIERSVFLHRDSRRVVPAVLEAPQAAHEERQRLARTDVADDPTHQLNLRLRRETRPGGLSRSSRAGAGAPGAGGPRRG